MAITKTVNFHSPSGSSYLHLGSVVSGSTSLLAFIMQIHAGLTMGVEIVDGNPRLRWLSDLYQGPFLGAEEGSNSPLLLGGYVPSRYLEGCLRYSRS